jgi:peptidoglycan/xylan/chitin deacetylase (PgdA/CDA1 family)
MERTRKKIKKGNNKKNFLVILTKTVLCIAVVSTSFIISINKEVKSSPNEDMSAIASEETSQKEAGKVEKDEFEGITLVNDDRGVPVICYHSVTAEQSQKGSIVIPKDIFRMQLKTIKDNGYTTLTMAELNDYLFNNKPIPEKSVVITFDDGYRDNYSNAFPILKEFNMKATIFVISSYFNRELYLTSDEIKEMSDYGIDIESHTVSHKILSKMSYNDQLKELKNSKETIESLTHKPVISFAYPEGKYNNDTKKAVAQAGYAMAFTIDRGYADRKDNMAQLNRICLDYTFKPNSILNVLKNLKK